MSSITNIITHTSALNGSGKESKTVLRVKTEQAAHHFHNHLLVQTPIWGGASHKCAVCPQRAGVQFGRHKIHPSSCFSTWACKHHCFQIHKGPIWFVSLSGLHWAVSFTLWPNFNLSMNGAIGRSGYATSKWYITDLLYVFLNTAIVWRKPSPGLVSLVDKFLTNAGTTSELSWFGNTVIQWIAIPLHFCVHTLLLVSRL